MSGLKRGRLLSHNKLLPITDDPNSNRNHTEYPAIAYEGSRKESKGSYDFTRNAGNRNNETGGSSRVEYASHHGFSPPTSSYIDENFNTNGQLVKNSKLNRMMTNPYSFDITHEVHVLNKSQYKDDLLSKLSQTELTKQKLRHYHYMK